MKNNVITVNFDNAKYRLVIGQPYFTMYYKGLAPTRFDIFDNVNINSLLNLVAVTGAVPEQPVVHATKKNTFVWGGLKEAVVERYDEQSKRYSVNKLSTKHGVELARAIIRAKAKKAA